MSSTERCFVPNLDFLNKGILLYLTLFLSFGWYSNLSTYSNWLTLHSFLTTYSYFSATYSTELVPFGSLPEGRELCHCGGTLGPECGAGPGSGFPWQRWSRLSSWPLNAARWIAETMSRSTCKRNLFHSSFHFTKKLEFYMHILSTMKTEKNKVFKVM